MYSERKDSFSIKTVMFQFLFVALFVFILIWLFPTKNYVNNLEGESTDLTVFYDRIFNENVIAMKDAAKSYFTTPRLPQNVGDKVTMTLGEMLEKKIILPFVDSEGEQCSLTESYVEITKYDEEFVMKVNLKCSEQENYLLVYMGCYDYCSTTICEKNKSDVKSPVIYPSKPQETKPVINNNNVINNVINNNNVIIITPTPEPEPDEPIEIPEGTPSCTLQVVSGKKSGNYYTGTVVVGFASKAAGTNSTLTGFGLGTSTNYNGDEKYSLTKAGTYTVYGYVQNNYGNTNVCSIDITIIDEKETSEKEYEYAKTTTTCSDYSAWSDWSTTYVEPTNLTQVAYRKVKTTSITGYKKVTSNDTSKPIYGTQEVVVGKLSEKICSEYGYTTTGTVAYSDWEYKGVILENGNIKSTDLTKYVRVTRKEEYCQEHCSSTTDTFYEVYERKAVSGAVYTCKNYATVTKLITAQKTVITGYEQITTQEPIYETTVVTQYRSRTRTCDTKTDKKWSKYNDTTLLNAGYKYTGLIRVTETVAPHK